MILQLEAIQIIIKDDSTIKINNIIFRNTTILIDYTKGDTSCNASCNAVSNGHHSKRTCHQNLTQNITYLVCKKERKK